MPSVVPTGAPRRRTGPRAAGLRRRVLGGALALAAGAGLAGCGGQAQEVRDALTYTGSVNRVQAGFERDLDELRRSADRAEVPADVERAVARLARSVDGVQGDLRRIRPPGAVTTLHRDLIAAFARWSPPLERFARALRARRSPIALRRARDAFVRDTATVERGLGVAAGRVNDRLRSLSD
ncbi:unannotated protein [freshwater metagenome]|uniref:Unannotated protein n=1 Tax=freshwater metagenome TaxID=449393 RepID=A0A6J7HQX3_9ZZZZ|nr:hypothetical protein [Actinomycetota bacterium]